MKKKLTFKEAVRCGLLAVVGGLAWVATIIFGRRTVLVRMDYHDGTEYEMTLKRGN
jgi:hypothetical protein